MPPLQRLLDHADNLAVPNGHLVVDASLARAQFLFWANNIWSIAQSILATDATLLPRRRELDYRAATAGARPGMNSFSDDELDQLATAFDSYRTKAPQTLTPEHVVHELFVPQLLAVELGFQGAGDRYPARPRTDDGDVHENRMLGHCLTAQRRYTAATLGPTDRVYRLVCRSLDTRQRADAADPVAAQYRRLITAYNLRHPSATVPRLHVPEHDFPTWHRPTPSFTPDTSGPSVVDKDTR